MRLTKRATDAIENRADKDTVPARPDTADDVCRAILLLQDVATSKPPRLTHSVRMLDRFGMTQFSRGTMPDLDHGYCVDDNARALLAAVLTRYLDPENSDAWMLGEAALQFLERCVRAEGPCHNLVAEDGSFTDDVGSQDSFGRLVWAAGVTVSCAVDGKWRERAAALMINSLDHMHWPTELRPMAYTILGLAAAVSPQNASLVPPAIGAKRLPPQALVKARRELEGLCSALASQFDHNAQQDWQWFEPMLSWGNARPAEALLRGGAALGNADYEAKGLQALRFLGAVTHKDDTFIPIGNRGWYKRGEHRAIYDQQPIEACAMVDAWLAAARLTRAVEYESKALEAFSWFLGLNTRGLVMVDPSTGGSYDGLEEHRINTNMGAESTLSYVHAHGALAAHFHQKG